MWSEVLLDDVAQAVAGEQLVLPGAQVQNDVGAARRLVHGLHREAALARALPAHAVLGAQARAPREQRHPVGHDEGRVESDAELADQVRILGAVGSELLEEFARTRLGDGADLLDHLLARHADAVVGHSDGARRRIMRDADPRLVIVFEERGVGERLEAQFVGGIRRVRHQLAQEDLLVAVQGVNHQVEELRHLGLEAERFLSVRVGHGC